MVLNKLVAVIAIGILTALLPSFVAAEVPKTTNTEGDLLVHIGASLNFIFNLGLPGPASRKKTKDPPK